MQSIDQLIGTAKHSSDLQSRQARIRYTLSSSVSSGQYHRHTLPKYPEQFIDMRSLRLRFQLQINSTDPNCCIDAPNANTLFSRVRVLCGSSVIHDVINSHVYNSIDENIHGSTLTENKYDKYLRGHGDLAQRRLWAQNQREYIISFQRKSVLNTNALLPLFKLSDIHIELFNATGVEVLHSPLGDSGCSFTMSDLELHANYISSKSISSYYATHPVQFSVNEVSHRFNNCTGMTSLLKFSSAHSSLNRIITLLRDSTAQDVTHSERASRGISAQTLDNFQLFINSNRYYDVNVDSLEQMFGHFKSAFKKVCTSEWYDAEYETTKFLLVNNLMSEPSDFSESVLSGVKTSAHNSDSALQIQFKSTPVSVIADSFLLCDGLISLPTGRSELMLTY
jgi:hypothetical protein